jgi:tetratricopeptide (TPR) repeat protein
MAAFIFIISFLHGSLHSQTNSNSLALAKNYEDDGLYEKALPIYEELYQKDPFNTIVIERLKNVYRILSKHDALIRVISLQLQNDTLNIPLLCELADTYFRAKKFPEAQVATQKVILTDPASESSYRLVATVLMSNRRFDDLEQIYLMGRKNIGDERVFVLEMANLLTYKGNYYEATKEYLRYYRFNLGNLNYVKIQILQFPDNIKDNASVIRAIREDLAVHADDNALNKLLIEILFRNEEYESAFELSKTLDEKKGRTGAEVLNFANMTFDIELYAVAQKAYAYFLLLYPNTPQAEMGIARCLEGMGSGDVTPYMMPDSASSRQKITENFYADKAIKAYRDLIGKYPDTEWSAEAYFHIGEIRLRKFFDVQEAYADFIKVAESNSPYRVESMFRIGECLLIEGNLEKSLEQYKVIYRESRDATIRDRARYLEAETYFYLQQFDSCQNRMKDLSRSQDGLFVNDALTCILLIQENQKEQKNLKQYAAAELQFRQKRYSEALALFSDMVKSSPEAPIVDEALIKIGEINVVSGQYDQALSVYRTIVDHLKNSPLADLALKRTGEIFEKLGKPVDAVKAYKELLIRYPKSIYGNHVRKRIRELDLSAKKTS